MAGPMTVAVTGLHRGDNPQPGASVIRSMRRRFPDLRVVGLSYDPLESGLYSRAIDRVDAIYLLPFPMKGPDVLLDRMRYVHSKEKFQYLIPCLDSEIANFLAIYPDLQRLGITALLPSKEALARRSKENLAGFCAHNAIPGPKTYAANDVATLSRFAAQLGYPVYVKGKYYEAFLVYSQVDLAEHFDSIARVWGVPILWQGLRRHRDQRRQARRGGIGNHQGLAVVWPVRDRISEDAAPTASLVRNQSALSGLGRFPCADRLQFARLFA
jgi:carbamoyl-phosphate synthase large subunit